MVERQWLAFIFHLCAIRSHAVDFTCLWTVKRELRIIRYGQIQQAVAIIIEPGGASSPPACVLDSCFVGHITESTVTVVVE